MDLVNVLISLISGIVGGNAAGAAMPDKSLGTLGNSIAGLVGGGVGGSILQALGLIATHAMTSTATGAPATGLDVGSIIGNIVGSGAGGAILTTVIAVLKGLTSQK